MFTSVEYKELGAIVAQVNRKTGALYINPSIWVNLPAEVKDYVLMHEEGHLKLLTASEYEANKYAVGKFIAAGTLNDAEFGRRIVVLSEILGEKGRNTYFKSAFKPTSDLQDINISNLDPISAIVAGASSIFQVLPSLGVGKKAREEEANNAAKNAIAVNQSSAEANKSKTQQYLMFGIIGFVFVIVIVVVVFKLKK